MIWRLKTGKGKELSAGNRITRAAHKNKEIKKIMEHYKIILSDLNTKNDFPLLAEVDEGETTNNIIIKAQLFGREITSSGENYLPSYQEFRDKLLSLGYGIKCNGSRLNAVQSGMMGASDNIYLVTMGRKARKEDIVSLWEYAEIDDFPNTAKQLAFFQKWLNG